MTDGGPGLKYRPEEYQALAVKWDNLSEEDRAYFQNEMTRPQWRRFERMLEDWREARASKHGKMVTHADLATFQQLYVQRIITPFENRIKAIEAYLDYKALPPWKKLPIILAAWWERIEGWLDRRGIRLVEVPDEGDR